MKITAIKTANFIGARDVDIRMDSFQEWWIDYRGFDDPYNKAAMLDCWEAARNSEREACAKACDAEASKAFEEGAEDWARGACMCAALIRERANV